MKKESPGYHLESSNSDLLKNLQGKLSVLDKCPSSENLTGQTVYYSTGTLPTVSFNASSLTGG